jgi:hypothetical protein
MGAIEQGRKCLVDPGIFQINGKSLTGGQVIAAVKEPEFGLTFNFFEDLLHTSINNFQVNNVLCVVFSRHL